MLIALAVSIGGAVLAPQVAEAWEQQTGLGYRPCRPVVTALPAELRDRLADANNGEQYGICEVRMALDLKGNDPRWLAWHEVCHLSTVANIYRTEASKFLPDPPHDHPFFARCMALGGYER